MKRLANTLLGIILLIGPSQLSAQQTDSRMLMDLAESCITGNHEPSDCERLRQGAETLDIPEIAALADMLEGRVLDPGNRQATTCVKALLDYAEKKYGAASREAVLCRRQLIASQWGAQGVRNLDAESIRNCLVAVYTSAKLFSCTISLRNRFVSFLNLYMYA